MSSSRRSRGRGSPRAPPRGGGRGGASRGMRTWEAVAAAPAKSAPPDAGMRVVRGAAPKSKTNEAAEG
jgi:hypothetical protein